MNKLYIIVEHFEAWSPYYPSDNLITAGDYLRGPGGGDRRGAQVINLCSRFDYLSDGYYCSLLAEARGHRVLPSTRTLYDLDNHSYYRLYEEDLDKALGSYLGKIGRSTDEPFTLTLFFGQTSIDALKKVGRRLFEAYPCPILHIHLEWQRRWTIVGVRAGAIETISEDEQDTFANAIDQFSRKLWRKPKARKNFRFELAILHNPDEAYPPSDARALRKFQNLGRELGVDVDLITEEDYVRLLEYDALFIRETTALNHHTYRFAKRAESEGLVVMDDPDSILRCTNKVFLAELLRQHAVPAPNTQLLLREEQDEYQRLGETLGYPLVLKIPDGSFSRGIVKVNSADELKSAIADLFRESAIILAQEFIRTDFDWRIGVLNGRPIFACQYFMARGHWQIYNHAVQGRDNSGDFRTIGVHQVPKRVLRTAVRSANLIGRGLYGVDLKQVGERCVVIEVNDNPNIDHGVEDAYLGDDLYRTILNEFIRRMEMQRQRF
ncbi:MAG: RimK family protein [Gammaproteobacteria bacterium]